MGWWKNSFRNLRTMMKEFFWGTGDFISGWGCKDLSKDGRRFLAGGSALGCHENLDLSNADLFRMIDRHRMRRVRSEEFAPTRRYGVIIGWLVNVSAAQFTIWLPLRQRQYAPISTGQKLRTSACLYTAKNSASNWFNWLIRLRKQQSLRNKLWQED